MTINMDNDFLYDIEVNSGKGKIVFPCRNSKGNFSVNLDGRSKGKDRFHDVSFDELVQLFADGSFREVGSIRMKAKGEKGPPSGWSPTRPRPPALARIHPNFSALIEKQKKSVQFANTVKSMGSGSNITAPSATTETFRDEQSEQSPDADVDSVGKLEYPLEDIQQRAIKTRRGQPDFRKRIFAAYGDKCAVTGCKVQSVLEAAHIIPHAEGTDYEISNGLPLRADIHTLFDLRLLAVSQDYRIHISRELADSEYGKLHGQAINLPRNKLDNPSPEKLAKHFEGFEERNSNKNIFQEIL